MNARIADASLFTEIEFIEIYAVAKLAAEDKGRQHAANGWAADASWYDMPELQARYLKGYTDYLAALQEEQQEFA